DVSGISAYVQVEGLTGADLEEVVGLPVAQEPGSRAFLQPASSLTCGNLPHCVPGEEMRNIKSRSAVLRNGRKEILDRRTVLACAILDSEIPAAVVERFRPGIGNQSHQSAGQVPLKLYLQRVVVSITDGHGVVQAWRHPGNGAGCVDAGVVGVGCRG